MVCSGGGGALTLEQKNAWMVTQLRAVIAGTPHLEDHPDDSIEKFITI